MNEVELQMLIMEHNACAHARLWDPIARQKMRSGQICSSCRRPLPQPHTPESVSAFSCASHSMRSVRCFGRGKRDLSGVSSTGAIRMANRLLRTDDLPPVTVCSLGKSLFYNING